LVAANCFGVRPIGLGDDIAAFLTPHLGLSTCLPGLPRTKSPSMMAAGGGPRRVSGSAAQFIPANRAALGGP
jgi:hypothetical protein